MPTAYALETYDLTRSKRSNRVLEPLVLRTGKPDGNEGHTTQQMSSSRFSSGMADVNSHHQQAAALEDSAERGYTPSITKASYLHYIDAPVWRRGNGEVLVGRDVVPHVGMRVNMSRQHRRWLQEQGQTDPSRGGAGVVFRIKAGAEIVHPAPATRWCNGHFCKVKWDAGVKSHVAVGYDGRYEIVPEESDVRTRVSKVDSAAVTAITRAYARY